MNNFSLVLSNMDWGRYLRNLVVFSAPALVIFFGQLALGVDFKVAGLVALLTFYQLLADFFRKFNESQKTLGM